MIRRETRAVSYIFNIFIKCGPGLLDQGQDAAERGRPARRGGASARRVRAVRPIRRAATRPRCGPAIGAAAGSAAPKSGRVEQGLDPVDRRRDAVSPSAPRPARPPAADSASDSAPRTSAAARRAGAPRSPLVTSTRSGISITPAFMNCSASPGRRAGRRARRGRRSRRSRSRTGRRRRSRRAPGRSRRAAAPRAGKVSSASPPSRRRAAIERTKTPASSGSVSIRARSPSSAPPESPRRRIDRDHRHGLAAPAKLGDQHVAEARLSDAGRSGQPEGRRRAALARRPRAARRAPGRRARSRAPTGSAPAPACRRRRARRSTERLHRRARR